MLPESFLTSMTPKQKYSYEYYEANRDKILAKGRAYQAANPDKFLAKERAYRAANPDKVRERAKKFCAARRHTKYGITKEQLAIMEEKQAGLCAICGKANRSKRALNVDHCHTSGKVRGLLCTCCNTGLGSFKDSSELLNRAISYLGANNIL